MDSKHFPSHSTTDNLPSSLTPGERQLNAAPPTPAASTTVDTQVTTTGTNTGPNHMSAGISAEDNDLSPLSENETPAPRPKPTQLIATSSDSSLLSSSSSGPSFDPESLSSTTSSTSVVSIPLSPSASLTGLHSPTHVLGQDVDVTVTLPNSVGSCDTSASSSLSASCSGAKLPHAIKDIVTPQVNLVSSSTKNISVNCDGKEQASRGVSSKVLPTDKKESPTCEDNSQSPVEKGVKRWVFGLFAC